MTGLTGMSPFKVLAHLRTVMAATQATLHNAIILPLMSIGEQPSAVRNSITVHCRQPLSMDVNINLSSAHMRYILSGCLSMFQKSLHKRLLSNPSRLPISEAFTIVTAPKKKCLTSVVVDDISIKLIQGQLCLRLATY